MDQTPSPARPARTGWRAGRGRAARAPLPVLVAVLAACGGCAIVLPLVGLGTRVAWGQLPQLLSTPSAQAALWLSVRTCLASTAVSVLLGVPLALALARSWPGVRVARVLAVLPMTLPPVVAGIALLSTLGRKGVLGARLDAWGMGIAFTTTAVVVAQVFVSMPYLVVTLEAALRSRDTRAETTARTLGAGPWRVLVRITLPLAAPALARGTALALGRSLGEFGATIAFAGSKEGVTRTMPLTIYLERESDTSTALALAVVLIVLSFIIVGATNVRWSTLGTLWRPGRYDAAGHGDAEDEVPARALDAPTTGVHATSPAVPDGQGRGRDLEVSFRLDSRDVMVSLSVPAGRTVALIGPNGSGKSTVCSVVAGLLDAAGGRVALGGRVLDGPEGFVPAGRREVALLSQDPGVFTHMSVLGNVVFALRCQGVGRSAARVRARAELAAVGALHLASRSGGALSGGQAARVALARALATAPRLLVLDEPMSALDVTARQEMRRLVAHRTAQEGLTLLLVTHDVLDMTALAEDVVVLEAGRVVERGGTAQVLASPSSDFAARLTGTAVLTGDLAGDGDAPALVLPRGVTLYGRPWEDDIAPAGHVPGQPAPPAPTGPGIALVPPDAVALYRQAPQGSPRNVLPGTVTGVERSGALVSVDVALAPGQTVHATVTAGALAEMGIAPGQELWCVIKAVEVRVVPQRVRQDRHDGHGTGDASTGTVGTGQADDATTGR